MKKLIILLLLMPVVFAQSVDVNLIEYQVNSHYTELEIANIGSEDVRNLKLFLNNALIDEISVIRQGAAAIPTLNVPPGVHAIKITSNGQTIFEDDLNFVKSKADVEAELQAENDAKNAALTRQAELQRQARQNEENLSSNGGNSLGLIVGVIILLIAIIIAYALLKKKGENEI